MSGSGKPPPRDESKEDPRWKKLDELAAAMGELDAMCEAFCRLAEDRNRLGYIPNPFESLGIFLPEHPEKPRPENDDANT